MNRMNRFFVPLVITTLLGTACIANARQEAFTTPDKEADVLIKATRSDDIEALMKILGPDGKDIISSGDDVADAAARQRFVTAYDARHKIAIDKNNKAIIVIGDEDFPFPIPIFRRNGAWQFDTLAGRAEILFRRIGRNELDAIQACLAYVDAQNEYAEEDRTGVGAKIYAQRFMSQPGQRDGLYWPTSPGEELSPLGELFADASAQGYGGGEGRNPYRGYYFKILTKQGAAAAGGAIDYVVRDKMIGGFALVAYPAKYRNSGVMTFLVNHEGTVFQKNLGPDTGKIAERLTSFNPDSSWQKVKVLDIELSR